MCVNEVLIDVCSGVHSCMKFELNSLLLDVRPFVATMLISSIFAS